MKNFLAALALLALPLAAHAQAIINMPTASEKHKVIYTRLHPFELDGASQSGYLYRAEDTEDNSGIMYCTDQNPRLRAEVPVAGDDITGFFDFESKETCTKIFDTMAAHPGLRVSFTVEFQVGAHPYPSNMSWRGGKVTQVEWLDEAK